MSNEGNEKETKMNNNNETKKTTENRTEKKVNIAKQTR